MNRWFQDPRTKEGELKAFEAERAERRGNPVARVLWREAGEQFSVVAIGVPADHPNTRSDLAIAAVASFARAGDFGRAVDVANRMLAEIDALSAHGRSELARLAKEYAERLLPAETTPLLRLQGRKPTLPAGGRSQAARQRVREQARHPERSVA